VNRLSICIPTFKRPVELEECLTSLLKFNDQSFEVIVGDDCSTDYTHEIVRKFEKEFKYFKSIKQESNIGFARNMDSIIRNSSREFIFVLNDDDFAIEDGIINCINILASNEKFSAVGARYIPTQRPDQSVTVDYSNAVATIYPKIFGAKHLIDNLSLCDCHPVMRRASFEDGCHYYDRTGMLIPIYFELIKRGDIAFIDKPIYQHRTTEVSLTTRMSDAWFIDMANADLEMCFADSILNLDKNDLEKYRKNLLSVIYFQAARMALLQGKFYVFWLFIKRYSSLTAIEQDFATLVDQKFSKHITAHRIAQIINDSKFKSILILNKEMHDEALVAEINLLTDNSITDEIYEKEYYDAAITTNRLAAKYVPENIPIIDIYSISNSMKLSSNNVEVTSISNNSLHLFSQLCANYFLMEQK